MSTIDSALAALRQAATRGKVDKNVATTIDQTSSYFILLKSSSPQPQALKKLLSVLRSPLVPIYHAFPLLGLKLSAAVFESVHRNNVTVASRSANKTVKIAWEQVLSAILSGVLDYLEVHESDSAKDAIADAFYNILCDIYFPPSSSAPQTSLGLTVLVHQILSDSSNAYPSNQHKLRDVKTLGGKRLGLKLAHSREFIVIESLLNVFARLIPSTNGSSAGRSKRTKFIREVFSEGFLNMEELVQTVERLTANNWDEAAVKIVDIFAKSNIEFPQPFALDEIRTCGITFRQSDPTERIYLDSKSVLADVPDAENIYESLTFVYSSILQVVRTPSTVLHAATNIVMHLSRPPFISDQPIKPVDGHAPTVEFVLQNHDLERFFQVLTSRGWIGPPKNLRKTSERVSIANSPTRLTINYAGSLDRHPSPSVKEKVHRVEQIYETNDMSEAQYHADDIEVETPRAEKFQGRGPTPDLISTVSAKANPQTSTGSKRTAGRRPAAGLSTLSKDVTSSIRPLRPSKSERNLEVAVFGLSDEELSTISDAESPQEPSNLAKAALRGTSPAPIKTPKAAKVSTVKGRRVVDSDSEDFDDPPFNPKSGTAKSVHAEEDPILSAPAPSFVQAMITGPQARPQPRSSARTKANDVADSSAPAPSAVAPAVPIKTGGKSAKMLAKGAGRHDEQQGKATPSKRQATNTGAGSNVAADDATDDNPPVNKRQPRRAAKQVAKKQNDKPSDEPTGAKRKRGQDARHDKPNSDDIELERRPLKRLRGALPATAKEVTPTPEEKPVFSQAARTAKTAKKYGKKGRTSSPVPASAADIDYDELPDASSVAHGLTSPAPRARDVKAKKKAPTAATSTKARTAAKRAQRRPVPPRKPRAKETERPVVKNAEHQQPQDDIANDEASSSPPPARELKPREAKKKAAIVDIPSTDDIEESLTPPEAKTEQVVGTKKPSSAAKEKTAPWAAESFLEKTKASSVGPVRHATSPVHETPPSVDSAIDLAPPFPDDTVSSALDVDTSEPLEYFTPVKLGSFDSPDGVSTPHRDVVMDDVTLIPSPEIVDKISAKTASAYQKPQTKLQEEPHSKAVAVTHGGAVAIPTTTEIIVLDHDEDPVPQLKPIAPTRAPVLVVDSVPAKITKANKIQAKPSHEPAPRAPARIQDPEPQAEKRQVDEKMKVDGDVGAILDAMNRVHAVVLDRMTRRFENVRSGARADGDKILQEGAADLRVMHAECVYHYNGLVDLEKEYASHARGVVDSLDGVVKINEEIKKHVGGLVKDHDRHSLSKRMPNSLFTSPLPSVFRNPAVPFAL